MEKGWICPKCGGVWAPWVDNCACCIVGGNILYPVQRRFEPAGTIKQPVYEIPEVTVVGGRVDISWKAWEELTG